MEGLAFVLRLNKPTSQSLNDIDDDDDDDDDEREYYRLMKYKYKQMRTNHGNKET